MIAQIIKVRFKLVEMQEVSALLLDTAGTPAFDPAKAKELHVMATELACLCLLAKQLSDGTHIPMGVITEVKPYDEALVSDQ